MSLFWYCHDECYQVHAGDAAELQTAIPSNSGRDAGRESAIHDNQQHHEGQTRYSREQHKQHPVRTAEPSIDDLAQTVVSTTETKPPLFIESGLRYWFKSRRRQFVS